MSAEALFKGLGTGLGEVFAQGSETNREKMKLDAESQMEKARLMEEGNLARFHEQSEDARAAKQRDMEKSLHDIDQAAMDRRQAAELKQAEDQFEQNFHMKVGEDFEQRVLTAQDMASRQLNDFQTKIMANPMLQMQYSDLLAKQNALAAETDPQKRAALQAQIESNGIYKGYQQVQQQALTQVMGVATNPTEYASLAVRFGRQTPEQAMVIARAKYGPNPTTTPATPAAPSAPASGAAPAAVSGGNIVTPDMLDQTRANVMGPGSGVPAVPPAAPSPVSRFGIVQPPQGQ